jgi:hypothetical protein
MCIALEANSHAFLVFALLSRHCAISLYREMVQILEGLKARFILSINGHPKM